MSAGTKLTKWLPSLSNQVRLTATTLTAPLNESLEWANAKTYDEMPGPKPIPLLGNTWRFIPYVGDYKIESIDKLTMRLYHQYGPIVKLGGLLGRPDMVFLYDADEIERVFRNEELMPYRPSMPSLNYYKHVLRRDFFGEEAGVIAVTLRTKICLNPIKNVGVEMSVTSHGFNMVKSRPLSSKYKVIQNCKMWIGDETLKHGEPWYKFRIKVQQAMLQPRTARLYIKPIEETAEAFVERSRLIRNKQNEMPDDYLNEIHKWSLESIARIALDVRLGCLDNNSPAETQEMIDAVVCFFQNVPVLELKVPFWKFFSTPTWRKYIKALDTMRNISLKHINTALKQLESSKLEEVDSSSSLLQRVLAMDNDTKTACILALDMFLVGIDTTSTAVASVLYQLSKHPEKQEILYKEIAKHLPDKSSQLTAQILEDMSYLKACIKETLRMYPVVIGNGRCMSKDTVIAGYQVPSGVQIVFQHYVISNLEKYFSEPHQFLPERWLKSNGCPKDNKFHPFASLPFGYGRRMCLGRRFADLEIQTIIAKMIQNFQIQYNYGDLDYFIHPMYTPKGPLKFELRDR